MERRGRALARRIDAAQRSRRGFRPAPAFGARGKAGAEARPPGALRGPERAEAPPFRAHRGPGEEEPRTGALKRAGLGRGNLRTGMTILFEGRFLKS